MIAVTKIQGRMQ